MIRLPDTSFPDHARVLLDGLQAEVDGAEGYEAQVAKAHSMWHLKKDNPTIRVVRERVAVMCSGRCGYCEDSIPDEIEHIRPKEFFPENVFVWENYLYACGPCNGTYKNVAYAVWVDTSQEAVELRRERNQPKQRPPTGTDLFINPRTEDPSAFLELDLQGTFKFEPRRELSDLGRLRATYTSDLLKLNRDLLTSIRRARFVAYCSMLETYAARRQEGRDADAQRCVDAIRRTDHKSVWLEMKRQHQELRFLTPLFAAAPEALQW
jgi:uncharacterized protein (TIGR02646 family)